MFSNGVVTLMTIEEVRKLTKQPASRLKDVADDDISYLCDGLVRRGHLVTNSLGEYQLTSKGRNAILREAIVLVTCGDEAWTRDRMEKLEQLHTEISRQIVNSTGKQQRVFLDKEYSTILQV